MKRDPIGSYYQLVIVLPASAIVLIIGGIIAAFEGYVGGLIAVAIGVALVVFMIWFARLPVREPPGETKQTT